MRLVRVQIASWRNFREIDIAVGRDAPLVCLVGENGTGKSNILEFIAAASTTLGLSTGLENRRGNPFSENHEAKFVLSVPDRYIEAIHAQPLPPDYADAVEEWDGTIILESRHDAAGHSTSLYAGGVAVSPARDWLAQQVTATFRSEQEIFHLYLDADRSYPPVPIQPHQVAEAWTQPWESADWTKQWAWRSTRTLYEEWMKYFLSLETRTATRFLAETREATQASAPLPTFSDPFQSFAVSVSEVLPHLTFRGVDTETRTITFDTSGTSITFDKLSGGEREIAFLIGQVERFQLRRGLFLIDEPELHLNPDLVRAWVAYLRDTVSDGQVWIATHSLEAVEVAGPAATFVLERAADTRVVVSADPLSARPVIAALSSTLGSPAFSISQRRFIYVEGERRTRERERFATIVGDAPRVRFVEAGGGRDVVAAVRVLQDLAAESDEPLRIGGVLDRDFASEDEAARYADETGVHVLGVHEVENLFLHPGTLGVLLERMGRDRGDVHGVLLAAADRFAGLWIVRRASHSVSIRDLRSTIRAAAGSLTWSQFEVAVAETVEGLAGAHHDESEQTPLAAELANAVSVYANLRTSVDLWKECLGKEVLGAIPSALGFSTQTTLERAVAQTWALGESAPPAELVALQEYARSL